MLLYRRCCAEWEAALSQPAKRKRSARAATGAGADSGAHENGSGSSSGSESDATEDTGPAVPQKKQQLCTDESAAAGAAAVGEGAVAEACDPLAAAIRKAGSVSDASAASASAAAGAASSAAAPAARARKKRSAGGFKSRIKTQAFNAAKRKRS